MRLEHPIFNAPIDVDLEFTDIETPENYTHTPNGVDLPDLLKGWKVHEHTLPELDPGLVLDPYGFEDSPDCEWISSGINTKGPRSLALGRQGNFFHWGFFGDPADMTASARQVFLNTVCYMQQFDGQRPLVARRAPARERVLLYMKYVRSMDENPRTMEIVRELIPFKVLAEAELDVDRITQFYVENMEYLRREEGQFRIDEDARTLGLSNRSLELLDALAARLDSDPEDDLALRLLRRYVPEELVPRATEFSSWIEFHRSRLFFSDVGGFRWYVTPSAVPVIAEAAGQRFRARLRVDPARPIPGELFEITLELHIDAGWHTDSPESQGGFPLNLTFELPDGVEPAGALRSPRGEVHEDPVLGPSEVLHGRLAFRRLYRLPVDHGGATTEVRVKLGITVCDALSCLPPQSTALVAELSVSR